MYVLRVFWCCCVLGCVGLCVWCLWCVARLGTRKNPPCVGSKRLRVSIQKASVCTGKPRACVQHEGVLLAHTEALLNRHSEQVLNLHTGVREERERRGAGGEVLFSLSSLLSFFLPSLFRRSLSLSLLSLFSSLSVKCSVSAWAHNLWERWEAFRVSSLSSAAEQRRLFAMHFVSWSSVEQLEVEEEDGDRQEEEEGVVSGEGESRRVRHVDDHGWK